MRLRIGLCLCAILWLIPSGSASATVIAVPGDHATIQGAIAAASPGDSILVSPGVYKENLDFLGKSLAVISVAGAEFTHLRPVDTAAPTVLISGPTAAGAEFRGFEVQGSGGSSIIACQYSSYCAIRDNIIYRNAGSGDCIGVYDDDVLIAGNMIAANVTRRAIGIAIGQATILDNTIDGNWEGIMFGAGSNGLVRNNAITACNQHGLAGHPDTADYNLIYLNGDDYECDGCYPNNLSLNPLFLGSTSGEYLLRDGSPCLDAGHPDPGYNDADGSRNDIGAFPKVPPGMVPWNVRIGNNDRYHVIEAEPLIAWLRYPSGSPSQEACEIQVGTDLDWTVAEVWAPWAFTSAATYRLYQGPELQDGVTYYLRLRLRAAGVWGQWRTFDLRTNSTPTAPVPLSPADGALLPARAQELTVTNGVDPDDDPLKYEFTIYRDPELMNVAGSRVNILETPGQTASGNFAPLNPGAEYWWRARAHDGYEWGAWSDSLRFFTRAGRTHHVPLEYASLQAAVDSSGQLDTILVGPGEHSENIFLRGWDLVITSSDGPAATIWHPGYHYGKTITVGNAEGASTRISGFTFGGGYAEAYLDVNGGAAPEITGNIFRDYQPMFWAFPVVITCSDAAPYIHHNLFVNNGGISCIGNNFGGRARIINNTFVNNQRGFYSISGAGLAANNIVVNSAEYGIYGFFALQHHNNVWGNHPDYDGGATADPTNLSVDPWFCDPSNGGYALASISPCATAASNGGYIGAYAPACSFPATCHCECHADPECDGATDMMDIVRTIARAFNADSTVFDTACLYHGPLADGRTDVDCNGGTDIADVTRMIDVVLRGADPALRFCAPCE